MVKLNVGNIGMFDGLTVTASLQGFIDRYAPSGVKGISIADLSGEDPGYAAMTDGGYITIDDNIDFATMSIRGKALKAILSHEFMHIVSPGLTDEKFHNYRPIVITSEADVKLVVREYIFRIISTEALADAGIINDGRTEYDRLLDTIDALRPYESQFPEISTLLRAPADQIPGLLQDPAIISFLGVNISIAAHDNLGSGNWAPSSGSGSVGDPYGGGGIDSNYSGATGGDGISVDASGLETPVVIDLSPAADAVNQSGDGLEFTDLYNSSVFYNLDEDGFRERTAWVGPNEGIVIYAKDQDNDGKYSRFEIALTNVVTTAKTDMEALLATRFDANGNKILTAAEADDGFLKIWQDSDMDGEVDSGEVKSFSQVGIQHIDLTDSNVANLGERGDGATADQVIETRLRDGSVIFGTAKVVLTNGETTAYDMGFAHESAGIMEKYLGTDFVQWVKLEKPTGAGSWLFQDIAAGSAVNWNFNTGGNKAGYYGGLGSSSGDTMTYSGGFSVSFAGAGGYDTLTGGDGDDFLVGGAGIDKLRGGRGNDVLYIDAEDFGGSNPVVDGEEGFDVLKVNSASGVSANMTQTNSEAFYGNDGNDVVNAGARMMSVLLSGEGGNDRLTGGDDDDILIGGNGNDSLSGGIGNDQLSGGKGIDSLYGNGGDDYIVADENDNFSEVKGGDGFDVLVIDDSVGTANFSQLLNLTTMGFEAAIGGDGSDTLMLPL